MSDTCNAVVTMAVDTKKYGIRIHKALFRQLGEPRYPILPSSPYKALCELSVLRPDL